MKTLMFCFKRKGFNPKGWYAADFWTPAFEVAELPASEKPSWATWDANFVGEVRRGFKACQVFAYFPLYWLTYNQINNNLTSQAAVRTGSLSCNFFPSY
jgi:POT family proton-dependent oligopeptide transporter